MFNSIYFYVQQYISVCSTVYIFMFNSIYLYVQPYIFECSTVYICMFHTILIPNGSFGRFEYVREIRCVSCETEMEFFTLFR